MYSTKQYTNQRSPGNRFLNFSCNPPPPHSKEKHEEPVCNNVLSWVYERLFHLNEVHVKMARKCRTALFLSLDQMGEQKKREQRSYLAASYLLVHGSKIGYRHWFVYKQNVSVDPSVQQGQ